MQFSASTVFFLYPYIYFWTLHMVMEIQVTLCTKDKYNKCNLVHEQILNWVNIDSIKHLTSRLL